MRAVVEALLQLVGGLAISLIGFTLLSDFRGIGTRLASFFYSLMLWRPFTATTLRRASGVFYGVGGAMLAILGAVGLVRS